MSDELTERVAAKFREMTTLEKLRSGPFTWEQLADAAIALARDDALEEAAKVADEHEDDMGHGKGAKIAAAIRALKGKP
jgi:hypothetical protein